MEKISFYTLDEVKDKQLGKIGTPHRDQYEAELNFWGLTRNLVSVG